MPTVATEPTQVGLFRAAWEAAGYPRLVRVHGEDAVAVEGFEGCQAALNGVPHLAEYRDTGRVACLCWRVVEIGPAGRVPALRKLVFSRTAGGFR